MSRPMNPQLALEWASRRVRELIKNEPDKESGKVLTMNERDLQNKLLRTYMACAKDIHGIREVEDMRTLVEQMETLVAENRAIVKEARALGVSNELVSGLQ